MGSEMCIRDRADAGTVIDVSDYPQDYIFYKCDDSGATSVSTVSGRTGQRIIITFANANTTLVNGASIVLKSGANHVSAANQTLSFVFISNGVLRELQETA